MVTLVDGANELGLALPKLGGEAKVCVVVIM